MMTLLYLLSKTPHRTVLIQQYPCGDCTAIREAKKNSTSQRGQCSASVCRSQYQSKTV